MKIYISGVKIVQQWIPVHVWILGNELADILAKKVTRFEKITDLSCNLRNMALWWKKICKKKNLTLKTSFRHVVKHDRPNNVVNFFSITF